MAYQLRNKGCWSRRDSLLQIDEDLLLYRLGKGSGISGLATQVVGTDPKRMPGSNTEQPFQGLWLDLYLFEGSLLYCRAPVRRIPVAKIRQLPARLAGHAPVGNFMQGTAIIVTGKKNSVPRVARARRKVFRLSCAADQLGIEIRRKAAGKQLYQILIMVGHGWLDNIGQVVRMGRFSPRLIPLMSSPESGTYRRRSVTELRALIWLALPIIAAQMAHTLLGFVDAAMAGRVSAIDLGAVALGNAFWVPAFLFLTGVLMIITSKVAANSGTGRDQQSGSLVRQGAWLGLFIGCLCAAFLFSVEPILHWMAVEPQLIPTTVGYLQAVALGFPAVALYQALRGLSDGLSQTKPTMLIGFLGLILNVPANYVLVYGKLGFPAMGAVGCGVATALVMWFMLGCMLVYLKGARRFNVTGLFERFDWPHWKDQRHLLSLGLPIGIALFAETSMFCVIALLIGGLGAVVVASHQVALNFSSLTFMVPFSLGLAITVRVGHSLGLNGARAGLFAAKMGMAVALVFALLAAALMWGLADWIPYLYTDDQAIIQLAAQLFVYAALYQVSDAIQVACAGALRGYQDTRLPMLLTLVAYWLIGLPSGYVLGLTDLFGPAQGPAGFWQGLIIGLSAAAVFLSLRLAWISKQRRRQESLRSSGQLR